MIKLRVCKGHRDLDGVLLHLKEQQEGIYKCDVTGIEIIDCWDEISCMMKYKKNTMFFDLHLFQQSEELKFIDEVKKIN